MITVILWYQGFGMEIRPWWYVSALQRLFYLIIVCCLFFIFFLFLFCGVYNLQKYWCKFVSIYNKTVELFIGLFLGVGSFNFI